jgi:hypothetical protein
MFEVKAGQSTVKPTGCSPTASGCAKPRNSSPGKAEAFYKCSIADYYAAAPAEEKAGESMTPGRA